MNKLKGGPRPRPPPMLYLSVVSDLGPEIPRDPELNRHLGHVDVLAFIAQAVLNYVTQKCKLTETGLYTFKTPFVWIFQALSEIRECRPVLSPQAPHSSSKTQTFWTPRRHQPHLHCPLGSRPGWGAAGRGGGPVGCGWVGAACVHAGESHLAAPVLVWGPDQGIRLPGPPGTRRPPRRGDVSCQFSEPWTRALPQRTLSCHSGGGWPQCC